MFLIRLCRFNFFVLATILYCCCYQYVANASSLISKTNLFFEDAFVLSDNLVVDGFSNTAIFNGNVKILHDDFIIKSDSLKIFVNYQDNLKSNLSITDSVNKIVADGNVNIQFDNKIAKAKCAIYFVIDNILILKGSNSSISYADSKITGGKIIYHVKDGRCIIDSGVDIEVNAIISTSAKNGK